MNGILLCTLFFLPCYCLGQSISFTDLELKRYLLNEPCVDTTGTSLAFSPDVDINNDNKIQWSEALAVQHLRLSEFADDYTIAFVQDLSNFSTLQSLTLFHLDELAEVSSL